MTQLQGLKNWSVNIKPTMLKIHDSIGTQGYAGKAAKLTRDEQRDILNFYLEVVDYLGKQS